jgi:hypothetical protein
MEPILCSCSLLNFGQEVDLDVGIGSTWAAKGGRIRDVEDCVREGLLYAYGLLLVAIACIACRVQEFTPCRPSSSGALRVGS